MTKAEPDIFSWGESLEGLVLQKQAQPVVYVEI